jgi:putative pyruvate formate lyase activating enzyme
MPVNLEDNRGNLKSIIAALAALLEHCVLCPRRCRINRLRGERGFCALGGQTILNRVLPHFGEEPPISGEHGAGTVFFSSCNLRCPFCQNYQISHAPCGQVADAASLAWQMLDMQRRGCHNIEAVTPTPQLPGFLEALVLAVERGLTLPVVYNCGGYEEPEIIRRLDGIIDIYLPDFKYSDGGLAARFSGAADYPEIAVRALREMYRQKGSNIILDEDGVIRSGLIVRHLVLPGQIENTRRVLRAIAEELSPSVHVSLMAQYYPIDAVRHHPELGRGISRAEYEEALEEFRLLGFYRGFVQDLESGDHLRPDFRKDNPFE